VFRLLSRSIPKRGGRRSLQFVFRFSHRSFKVSIRYFKTDKSRRSKLSKQFVVPLRGLPIREVALTLRRHRKVLRKEKTSLGIKKVRWTELASLVLGIAGIVYFAPNVYGAVRLDIKTPDPAQVQSVTTVSPPKPITMSRSVPLDLRIPKISVSTPLISVGLQSNGSLVPPANYHEAGWYNGAPTPGEKGPAVIVGHVDNVQGIGVFWRIRELQPGNEVDVDRSDGTTATFKIDAVAQYSQNNFPTETVYGDVSYAGIRIITCGGIFSTQTHHYSDNIVVYGSLVKP